MSRRGKWVKVVKPGSPPPLQIWIQLFLYFLFSPRPTPPVTGSGIRGIKRFEFSCRTTSRAAWRGGRGFLRFSYMKGLSFSIYRTATALWNKTLLAFFSPLFFSRHDFISNLSLPFQAGNWKQRREEALRASEGCLECWPGETWTQSAYSSYWAPFCRMFHVWWEKAFWRTAREDARLMHGGNAAPGDVDGEPRGLHPAG